MIRGKIAPFWPNCQIGFPEISADAKWETWATTGQADLKQAQERVLHFTSMVGAIYSVLGAVGAITWQSIW